MEKRIVEYMKLNTEIMQSFSKEELEEFLNILTSNDSDAKRQERFIKLIKGEKQWSFYP